MTKEQREQLTKDQAAFAQNLEWFIRNYAPRDRYDERDFSVNLYALLDKARQIAQAPLIAEMSAAMALIPSTPIVFPTCHN